LFKKSLKKSLNGPAGIALLLGGDDIDFQSFLLRFLSHFLLHYLQLIQLSSISVIIRIMLTV